MRPRVSVLKKASMPGFTLVEVLLTMALLGVVTLSVTNMLVKASSMSSSMDTRYQMAIEAQAAIMDMIQDLQQGAYISNNSHNYRLEYTTYNSSGTAMKKVYGICYAPVTVSGSDTTCGVSSGTNTTPFLKLSLDGGSTWGSPFRMSSFNKYALSGTPKFLYAQDANNCTTFVDTNANGVWLGSAYGGSDAAGVTANCGNYTTTSPVLNNPNQASKVVLSGFQFTTLTGTTAVTRSIPTNLFMLAPQGVVISTSSAVSPAVKDSALLKSFDTATANSMFGSGFIAYGIAWDPVRQRILVAGQNSSTGMGQVFQVDRTGVLIGPPKTLAGGTTTPNAIALLSDGNTILVQDYAHLTINWYNLNGPSPLQAFRSLNLSNPSSGSPSVGGSSALVQYPFGMTVDPKYPDEVFVVAQDPADNNWKIFEISATTGALATNLLSGGKVSLPGAFSGLSTFPGGLTQEPTTGDFLVTLDNITGSAPNRVITIYRITSGGSSSTFTVNVDDLGSTASGTNGNFGIAYDADSNHLFFTDIYTHKIYEVYPDRLISPRS